MAAGNIETKQGQHVSSAIDDRKVVAEELLSSPSSPQQSVDSSDDGCPRLQKRVSFSRTSMNKLVPHFRDYTRRQWNQIWYTEEELNFFKERHFLREQAALLSSSRRSSDNSRSSRGSGSSSSSGSVDKPSPSLFGSLMNSFKPSPASSTKSERSSLSSYSGSDQGSSEQSLPPPPHSERGRNSLTKMLLGLASSSPLTSNNKAGSSSRARSLSPSPAAQGGKNYLKAQILAASRDVGNSDPTKNDGGPSGSSSSRPPMLLPPRVPNGLSHEDPAISLNKPPVGVRRNVSEPDGRRKRYDRAPRRKAFGGGGSTQKPQRQRSRSF